MEFFDKPHFHDVQNICHKPIHCQHFNHLTFSSHFLQPPVINALGPVSNVSSPITATVERPDRILPAVSMSGLVSELGTDAIVQKIEL